MYKEWSRDEESYLIENAGKVPLSVLSETMSRSADSIKQKARQLNRQGACISLRYKQPRTVPCPSCGKMRSRINLQGICRCCELRGYIQKAEADIAKALKRLSVRQREIYRRNEAQIRSRVDPMPPSPVLPKNNPRLRARTLEDYAIECEKVEIRNLERVFKARRRRYERMCEKFVKGKINDTFPGQEGVLDENKPSKPQKRPNKQGYDPTTSS